MSSDTADRESTARADLEDAEVVAPTGPAVPAARVAPDRRERRDRLRRALPRWAGMLLVVLTGAAVGAVLAPATPARVGPLLLEVRVVPSVHPGVQLLLPPIGRVEFDTHTAPVAVQARVGEVDVEAAQELLNDPRGLTGLQDVAPDALRTATLRAALVTGLFALAGACAVSLLVYRRVWRRTAEVAAGLVGLLVLTGIATVATFDADRLAQPHFTGLLSRAPYVAGQAGGLVDRLESYRSGLADIVRGVTALYATSDELPVVPGTGGGDVVRVLHVSDIHLNPLAFDLIERLVTQFKVDVVVDTGDITSWGTEVESATLSRIREVKVPYVFVRGNHDSRRTQAAVAANPNAVVLDGDVVEVKGLVFAGVGDPAFTPDAGAALSAASSPSRVTIPDRPTVTPAATATVGPTSATPSGNPGVAPSAVLRADQQDADPQVRAGARLADLIRQWDAERPQKPVDVALVHEPASIRPLLGTVPLVLSGHLHKRGVRVDPSGTRVMVEGSTGGAGITAGTVDRLAEGSPVPLSATILYIARSGERARQVIAYDEVTVGGFGLASVSLERTVVRPEDVPAAPTPTPAVPGGAAEPATTPGGAATGRPRAPASG